MSSIYHFFRNLIEQKNSFLDANKLEYFPYDKNLLSCENIGKFPDMAIRLNSEKSILTGGELIELKDSKSYTVSSFNSTIPTGKKNINDIITGIESSIQQQMQQHDNDIYSLPIRDVFYLIRGRKKSKNNLKVKVCLVHGSFFETVTIEKLIGSSFEQVLIERLEQTGEELSDKIKKKLITLLSIQESFSKVRNVDKASVKLRFRIMTEVKAEGNILNSRQYPAIKDNTLNLVLPCHDNNDEELINRSLNLIFEEDKLINLNIFKIKHHFNGHFFVIQTNLDNWEYQD